MIIAGHLMLPAASDRVELAQGWLRIEAGKLAQVERGTCPHTADLGGDGFIITPGFIDTHVHLPQFDAIGCDGLPLLEWLASAIFPMERRWEDTSFAAKMTERVLDEFLSHGTTSFCAYATVHHEATAAAMELTHERGLRACIGQTLMDRLSPEYLMCPTRQLLAEARTLLDRYPPGRGRLEFGITPRFAGSCTPELMQAAAKMAAASKAIVQTHLAETVPECEMISKLFDGQPYTAVYAAMGLLGSRTLLGHGIYLSPDERRLIYDAESVIAHCPNANVFLRSGVMPRSQWKNERLRLSLGSDIGAGFEVSMPRVARAMIDAAKYLALSEHGEPELKPPTASEAWHQITAGNADAVGWPQIGRLTTGAEADVLLLKPQIAWRESADPLAMLLYAWDDRWLKNTIVGGKVAYAT